MAISLAFGETSEHTILSKSLSHSKPLHFCSPIVSLRPIGVVLGWNENSGILQAVNACLPYFRYVNN
ncbi:uncharacterized protein DS421_16g527470 [Arachis hypogaea]|nr:uncharacterized protein DS421_16g527470 [Arachis hypogaea]